MNLGRNKRGFTLNPRKPAGQEVLERLVATADIVVANLPRKGLMAMGLDYRSLKRIKPDIILTSAGIVRVSVAVFQEANLQLGLMVAGGGWIVAFILLGAGYSRIFVTPKAGA